MTPAVHMNRAVLWLVAVSLLGILAVSIEGCTAMGLLLGMAADGSEGTGGPGKLLEVKPGQWVSLERYDGTTRQGRFLAVERDSGAVDTATTALLQNLSVRIAGERGDERIALSSIAKVRTPTMKGTIAGLLVGATLDFLVIRSAKKEAENADCSGAFPALGGISMAVPDSLTTAPPEIQAAIEHQKVSATP